MQILISLPQSSDANTYQDIKAYLKQLELAVTHAQKSVESAEKNGIEVTENASVFFEHPGLAGLTEIKGKPEEFTSNYYDELQSVELKINLE